MISSISNALPQQVEPAQLATPAAQASSTPVKPQAAITDTVQLSGGSRAALQELSETPAQTAKEAAAGDAQAKRLLAREAHH